MAHMFNLYNNESGILLGSITDDQMAFLREQMEEESLADVDYYIMAPTVDLMEANGAAPALIDLLRNAIGAADGVEIRFEKAGD